MIGKIVYKITYVHKVVRNVIELALNLRDFDLKFGQVISDVLLLKFDINYILLLLLELFDFSLETLVCTE